MVDVLNHGHHRRKPERFQERRIRNIILRGAFYDPIRCEAVNVLSHEDVLVLLGEKINGSVGPTVEKGEVLVDSYGRGSFQPKWPDEQQACKIKLGESSID